MSINSSLTRMSFGLALVIVTQVPSPASAQNRAASPLPMMDEVVQIGEGDHNACEAGYEQVLRGGRLIWRHLVICQEDSD